MRKKSQFTSFRDQTQKKRNTLKVLINFQEIYLSLVLRREGRDFLCVIIDLSLKFHVMRLLMKSQFFFLRSFA